MRSGYICDLYGRSLYSVVLDKCKSEAELLQKALQQDSFFASSRFSVKLKLCVLQKFGLSAEMYNFCATVVSNGKGKILLDTISAYLKTIKDKNGEVDALVKTCVPLQKSDSLEVCNFLLNRYPKIKKVNIKNVIDKSLMGGLSIKFDSKMIDASVAATLKRLHDSVKNGLSASFIV